MHNRDKRLLQYSCLNISFILLHASVDAQAVYIDIEPDFILDEQYEMEGIDLDSDNLTDFYFFNTIFTDYRWPFGQARQEIIWAGAFDTMANGIAGSYNTWDTSYGGFTRYYPFFFNEGDNISSLLNFQNWNYQRMAAKTYALSIIASSFNGNWYPDIADKYLGIKFKDESNKLHYGWIRCTVTDNGRTLIVKDYAYESKHDIPIMAGDTIGSHEIALPINETENNNPSIYSFHKNIIINFSEQVNEETEIHIYTVTGENIYTDKIQEQKTTIQLENLNPGIYVVELITGENKYYKKVFIE